MANAVHHMRAFVAATLLAIALLLSFLPHTTSRVSAEPQDDELARIRAELNATLAENARLSSELNASKAALKEAQEDRDAYADRLESSTIILVMALALISIATAFFYTTSRRRTLAMRDAVQGREQKARAPRRRG